MKSFTQWYGYQISHTSTGSHGLFSQNPDEKSRLLSMLKRENFLCCKKRVFSCILKNWISTGFQVNFLSLGARISPGLIKSPPKNLARIVSKKKSTNLLCTKCNCMLFFLLQSFENKAQNFNARNKISRAASLYIAIIIFSRLISLLFLLNKKF